MAAFKRLGMLRDFGVGRELNCANRPCVMRLLDLSVTDSEMFWKDELFGDMLKFVGRPLPTSSGRCRFKEEVCGLCLLNWPEKSRSSWLEDSLLLLIVLVTWDKFGCRGSWSRTLDTALSSLSSLMSDMRVTSMVLWSDWIEWLNSKFRVSRLSLPDDMTCSTTLLVSFIKPI